jgi:hypothetical protein
MPTPLEALADLGSYVASVYSGNIAYTSSPLRLSKVGQSAIGTSGTQLANIVAKFNAVSAAIGASPPGQFDTFGLLWASITYNQNGGGHCLSYSTSTHLLSDDTHAYNYQPSGAETQAIADDFNALASALGAGTSPRGIIFGGQSLAANWSGAASSPSYYSIRHSTLQRQINPVTGLINPMSVPMLADGSLDSFLPQMADLLLDDIAGIDLVTSSIAVGGTTFDQFAYGGTYNGRIASILAAYASNNIPVNAVCWQQGESDNSNGTTRENVCKRMQSIFGEFRRFGYIGPIIVAYSTVSQNGSPGSNVRNGIADAVALTRNTFVGPDIDNLLTSSDRYDGTHPNYAGETKEATAWRTALSGWLT